MTEALKRKKKNQCKTLGSFSRLVALYLEDLPDEIEI